MCEYLKPSVACNLAIVRTEAEHVWHCLNVAKPGPDRTGEPSLQATGEMSLLCCRLNRLEKGSALKQLTVLYVIAETGCDHAVV